MFRVELLDGTIVLLHGDELARFAGRIKAFVLQVDEAGLDFETELSQILAEAAADRAA